MVDNLLSPHLWYEIKIWPSHDFKLSRVWIQQVYRGECSQPESFYPLSEQIYGTEARSQEAEYTLFFSSLFAR